MLLIAFGLHTGILFDVGADKRCICSVVFPQRLFLCSFRLLSCVFSPQRIPALAWPLSPSPLCPALPTSTSAGEARRRLAMPLPVGVMFTLLL